MKFTQKAGEVEAAAKAAEVKATVAPKTRPHKLQRNLSEWRVELVSVLLVLNSSIQTVHNSPTHPLASSPMYWLAGDSSRIDTPRQWGHRSLCSGAVFLLIDPVVLLVSMREADVARSC